MNLSMSTLWRDRLIKVIEQDERSPRAISLDANLGPNYITQMMTRGTSPSMPNLAALCEVLGVSLTEILVGSPLTPADEELLQLAAGMPERRKAFLLAMAREFAEAEPPQE